MAFRFGVDALPTPPATLFGRESKPRTDGTTTPPSNTSPKETVNALKSPTKLSEGVEGTVSFKSRSFTSYRYRITTKNDQLRIWLEDTKSKKQWETSALSLEDFVREDSVIPMAKFPDYAVCFANCLQNTTSPDFACDLTPAGDNSDDWLLSMTLKLRVFVTEWTPTYTMLLKAITLEPTDVLAAKIRDQEDQIQRLESQLKILTANSETPAVCPPAFVTGRSTQRSRQNQSIVWKVNGFGNMAFVFASDGGIRFVVAATFAVDLTVLNNNVINNTPTVELQLNGKVVSSCNDSNRNGHVVATHLCHVFTSTVGDSLTVVYRGQNEAFEGSQIVIYQLR